MGRSLLVAAACALACGPPSLHQAVSDGDAALVQSLLASGADPNAIDARGLTPRRRAEELGEREIVHLLLLQEALVDDDGVLESREGPPPGERYAARVLADLGHDPADFAGAIRAFQESEAHPPNGELTRGIARLLWIRDPITSRQSQVRLPWGACHVCISRLWRHPDGRGLHRSSGGCTAPQGIRAKHEVPVRRAESELAEDEIVEVVSRHGVGCRLPETP